jgi:hypothetical protein
MGDRGVSNNLEPHSILSLNEITKVFANWRQTHLDICHLNVCSNKLRLVVKGAPFSQFQAT